MFSGTYYLIKATRAETVCYRKATALGAGGKRKLTLTFRMRNTGSSTHDQKPNTRVTCGLHQETFTRKESHCVGEIRVSIVSIPQ